MTSPKKTTHFGFKSVLWDEKEQQVGAVFDSVARNYDRMNNLMSGGIHHVWKYLTAQLSLIRPGQVVLDLAGGSGDLTRLLSRKVGSKGQVILADINNSMLQVGRNRLTNAGFSQNVRYVQANAQTLPFASNSMDCITIGFGLRNVTDKAQALASMFRVCKPGGKIMVLEFSKPQSHALQAIYDWYSFNILPKLGAYFAEDAASYAYLAESIRMHPDQETLKTMIEHAGFESCRYHNLTHGIVALHIAYKY